MRGRKTMELRSELGASTFIFFLNVHYWFSKIWSQKWWLQWSPMVWCGGGKEWPKWSLFAPNDPHFVAKYRNNVRAVKPNSLSANFHCTETELHFKLNHLKKFDYQSGNLPLFASGAHCMTWHTNYTFIRGTLTNGVFG